MKKYKTLLECIVFSLITLAMLCGVNWLLRDRETTLSNVYSEEKNSIDMILVGSSHINNGSIPSIFWQENGLSAENVYSWAQPTWTAYHYVREAMKNQDLQLVVVDMYCMMYGHGTSVPTEVDKTNYATAFNLKPSINFLQLIRTSEQVGIDLRQYEDFLNLPRYHTRWKMLNEKMFTYDPSNDHDFLKGYGITYSCKEQQRMVFDTQVQKEPYEFCVEYLDKIVRLCRRKNVELVLTMMPYVCTETEIEIDNWIREYAQQQGIPYISYIGREADRVDLDYSRDFQDATHLNYYGAQKITMDLSAFIKEQYPDMKSRALAHRDSIQADYQKYLRVLTANELMVETDVSRYLSAALADENYVVYLANDHSAVSEKVGNVLAQHGVTVQDVQHFSAVLQKESCLTGQNEVQQTLFGKPGSVQFELDGQNVEILLNGVAVYSIPSDFKAVLYDTVLDRPLETVAYNAQTGLLEHKEFSSDIIGLFQK